MNRCKPSGRLSGGNAGPAGVKAYVTGPAAIAADMGQSGDKSLITIMAVSTTVTSIMLLFVYRSVITVILLLLTVGIELQMARESSRFSAITILLSFSTFAINLLVAGAIAAETDDGIFFFGRYQEARQAARIAKRPTTPHTAGSPRFGPRLRFDDRRSNVVPQLYPDALFPTPGRPLRGRGISAAVAAALTLVRAVCGTVGSRFGAVRPQRTINHGPWMAAK